METVLLTLLTTGFLPAVGAVWWYFRSQHKSEIERLEKSHGQVLADLKEAHAKEIEGLKEGYRREISMIVESHRREVDTLTRFHSERVDGFNARIDELRDSLAARDEKLNVLDDTLGQNTQALSRVSEILLTQAEVSHRQVMQARRMTPAESESSR